jgi:UDP-N-acetylmuramoyl-L-alanyl-D-glutamate--2,6-diaminopimelate ligase
VITLFELAELTGGTLVDSSWKPPQIDAVMTASDQPVANAVFVAIRGSSADGHDFLDEAFANGAVAAVVTEPERLAGRPGVAVDDSRRALSRICATLNGEPSRDLLTIGVTGTNGKTTVHWLLYHALFDLGFPALRIGSLGIEGGAAVHRSGKVTTRTAGQILMTTPAPGELHSSMRQARDAGLQACVLETSSHALDQQRVADVAYDAAVFTNLSSEHLDYHPDLEAYFRAKVQLFEQLADLKQRAPSPGGAAINLDCPYGRRLAETVRATPVPVVGFGATPDADVRIGRFDQQLTSSAVHLVMAGEEHTVHPSLIGDYNASNVAAAFATLVSLGLEPQDVASALSEAPPVPGRLQPVGSDDITVLVDYAHTGEGLRKALGAVRGFTRNRLWVVFGCGGGKDPGKRAAMGAAARELADQIVLTSDNPKLEDPAKIIEDILTSGCEPALIELDRRTAIERTLRSAEPGDIVLLAGKGHEDYQIIGNETFHFSDVEEVERLKAEGALDRAH